MTGLMIFDPWALIILSIPVMVIGLIVFGVVMLVRMSAK